MENKLEFRKDAKSHVIWVEIGYILKGSLELVPDSKGWLLTWSFENLTASELRQIADKLDELNGVKDIVYSEIIKQHIEFTSKTFTNGTSYGALLHLKREIEEVMEESDKNKLAVEFADCLGCLIDSANRAGVTPDILFKAFYDKLQLNKSRQWQDNGDGSYSHIKH